MLWLRKLAQNCPSLAHALSQPHLCLSPSASTTICVHHPLSKFLFFFFTLMHIHHQHPPPSASAHQHVNTQHVRKPTHPPPHQQSRFFFSSFSFILIHIHMQHIRIHTPTWSSACPRLCTHILGNPISVFFSFFFLFFSTHTHPYAHATHPHSRLPTSTTLI